MIFNAKRMEMFRAINMVLDSNSNNDNNEIIVKIQTNKASGLHNYDVFNKMEVKNINKKEIKPPKILSKFIGNEKWKKFIEWLND